MPRLILWNNKQTNKKGGGTERKITTWCDHAAKKPVRRKKNKYKELMRSKQQQDCIEYQTARRLSKKVKGANIKSWKVCGEALDSDHKENMKIFY